MAATALAFAWLPRPSLIFSFAVLFGLGYGAFLSVGWALAVDALPEARHAARDLGLWGIASNLPAAAAAAPVLGGWILSLYAAPEPGYRMLFLVARAAFAAGSAVVLRIGAR